MNWLAISIIAYFFLALEVILDKFLLSSKRVSHPVIYAFYTGMLGLFALVFVPFGFHGIGAIEIISRLIVGMIFIYGMLCLFFALNKSEASRVTPVVGAVIPIVIFFLSIIFLNEQFHVREIYGIAALIIGGLWISYDFEAKRKMFPGFFWSILAGVLLAISATALKGFYLHDNFFNAYIWTRVGAFLGVLVFFLVPAFRNIIFLSLFKFKKPERRSGQSGILFVVTRSIGGLGSILKEKATSFTLASVTVVNALSSTEYVFIFLMGLFFSIWLPDVFQEKKDWKNIIQKVLGIVIITIGLILVAKAK